MAPLDSEATLDPGIELEGEAAEDSALARPAELEIRSLWSESWALFRAAPGAYVLADLIVFGASLVSLGLLAGPLTAGFVRLVEAHRRGETIEAAKVLEGTGLFAPALFTGLIIGLGVALGTLALIIPGVVLGVMWSFALHFVALRDKSALAALGASWALARRQIGSVLLVLLAALALTFIGGVVILGVVVTTPLSLILLTLSFHELDDPDDRSRE